MNRYKHELCLYDLRHMDKHEINKHYFEFIRNANKEERELYNWYGNTRGLYKCRICGGTQYFIKGNFKNYLCVCSNRCNGCKIGTSSAVIVGYNNVAITSPELIKYFTYFEDGYTHTCGSKDKVNLTCPICKQTKNISLNQLKRDGFSCDFCSDGVSYPEKVVALVLNKLGVGFERQYKFDSFKYRYDFYLANYDIIVEVHGEQHYRNVGFERSYREEHENDLAKYDLAVLNGYECNKDYFIINASKSNIQWLRCNIEQCGFFKQFDLSNIDWKDVDVQAQKSLKLDVCRCWKKGKEIGKDLTTTDLAKEFGVYYTTIAEYLKWGNENGFCDYSGEEERKNTTERQSTFVYLVKPNGEKWFEEPMSQNELARQSGIAKATIRKLTKSGNSLHNSCNAKFDLKYVGSYIVVVDK